VCVCLLFMVRLIARAPEFVLKGSWGNVCACVPRNALCKHLPASSLGPGQGGETSVIWVSNFKVARGGR
jgi:hypothetical protein